MCLLRLCLAVAIRQGECRADPKATIRMPMNNNQPHRCSRQSVPRQPHLQESRSPLCVLVGAFPGAVPPLIGWAAASGRLSIEAGVLYAMLFLWQFPHYMANCVDVPRRLRSRRLFGSAEGQCDGSVHDVGNSVAAACSRGHHHHAMSDTARGYFLLCSGSSGNGIHVLRMEIRVRAFESCRTSAADGLEPLSTAVVRSKRDVMHSGQMIQYSDLPADFETSDTSAMMFDMKKPRASR
jgi:hypothetical protein